MNSTRVRLTRAIALFVALLLFWQMLSARLDPLFIFLGVCSALLSTWFGLQVLDSVLDTTPTAPRIRILPMAWFLIWLLGQIPPAGIAIARVVVDPRRPPQPGVVHFTTALRSPAARTLLATAITLVPGTITINVDGGRFTVHAFTPDTTADLANARMQNMIARAFGLEPEQPPVMSWEPVHDEVPEDAG